MKKINYLILVIGLLLLTSCNIFHKHEYTDVIVEPTCTEIGYTKYICSCGKSIEDQYVSALGHDYKETVVKPTCTEKGYTEYKCKVCGEISIDKYVNETGHHYVDEICSYCGIRNKYNKDNVLQITSLITKSDKYEINQTFNVKAQINNGIWFETGNISFKTDLRLFYYVSDNKGKNRLLQICNIGEGINLSYDTSQTIEIYCILAHKDFETSKTETKYLKSEIIKIKITGTLISTPEELQNINKTGYYTLKNDIDLKDFNFNVIEEFNGILDGDGYTIKNLTLNVKQNYVGLFGKCGGTVKNLNLENVSITVPEGAKEYQYVGGITGYSSGGTFENITVSGNIEANKTSYVGGIAGYVYKAENHEFKDLKNEANITGTDYVGGIFGYLCGKWQSGYSSYSYATYEINELENSGVIIGNGNYVGGLFGYMIGDSSKITMEDCNNIGDIDGNLYVGGISGYGFATCYNVSNKSSIIGVAYVGCLFGRLNGIIEKCYNEGSTLDATGYDNINTKNAYVGGFVGYGQYLNAKSCVNKVDINYTSDGSCVGGIAGYVYKAENHEFKDLKNEANITGTDYVGGIFGYLCGKWESGYNRYSYATYEMNELENSGVIIGNGNCIGGLFGYLVCGILVIKDSSNLTNVSGNIYVGGIVGYLNCYSSSEAYNLVSLEDVRGTENYDAYFGSGTLIIKE